MSLCIQVGGADGECLPSEPRLAYNSWLHADFNRWKGLTYSRANQKSRLDQASEVEPSGS